ncbi:hypothetical protein BU15DRAFT_69541 [Melanogaster broomeanus]|nr:hypothetical protein BU15DRAFT_69541 [Melanogaster broomeanus]
MNVETISQLEFNHLTPNTISLPNGEEQCQFLHLRNGHVIIRFDNHFYAEEAARQFLDAYIYLMNTTSLDCKVPDGGRTIIRHRKTRLANNLIRKYKRPAGLVLQIATGNVGRATTTISFPSHDAPRLIFGSTGLVAVPITALTYKHVHRARDCEGLLQQRRGEKGYWVSRIRAE